MMKDVNKFVTEFKEMLADPVRSENFYKRLNASLKAINDQTKEYQDEQRRLWRLTKDIPFDI